MVTPSPQRCLRGFWGSPKGVLGEKQRCLRVSVKGTQQRGAEYSPFLLV